MASRLAFLDDNNDTSHQFHQKAVCVENCFERAGTASLCRRIGTSLDAGKSGTDTGCLHVATGLTLIFLLTSKAYWAVALSIQYLTITHPGDIFVLT